MKRLFELGNQYVRESDWKDLALVKFCLCAMGIMIGTQVPTKHKKAVVTGALGVFVVTYIPLMAKLFKIAEYYGAAEPPVRCGESHLSGLTEPPHFVY